MVAISRIVLRRLDNADVIDVYDRVQVGAKVLVRQSARVFLIRTAPLRLVAKNVTDEAHHCEL